MDEASITSEQYIAHVRQNADDSWNTQSLADHLNGTARRAGVFSEAFGSRDWGELLGYWHDLGKFIPTWQKHIRKGSGYEDEAFLETASGRINHSTVGAVTAFDRIKEPRIARILSYGIAGHHAGLPDWEPDEAGGDLVNRLYSNPLEDILDRKELKILKSIGTALPFLNMPLPKSAPMGVVKPEEARKAREHLHLWIRMLYSCLVDADFLDTEEFMQPEKAEARGRYPSLHHMKKRFDEYMAFKYRDPSNTSLNKRRNEVLARCREKALRPPGLFSLNVPTGGGKTLSAMAFALEHALAHGMKRIVIAIPYTSIVEQTASVYSEAFGEGAVVEHHSNLDPEKETIKSRLASENWDAPIIVTTNVQLFESLFAAKSSACRKLHNIVGSVIILDEAQMLPPEYLKPILSSLRGLVERFRATAVICTATQPALEGRIGSGMAEFSGLEEVMPIVDDPNGLASDLKRVSFHFPKAEDAPSEWKDIADQLIEHEQVLCVVNTKRSCRELHALMPEGTIHLSASMCGEERSDLISVIKGKLGEGKPIRVISTQLVEAGVDIDFPVVFRAMAGLDSIAQAAGRCNREMKLNAEGKLGQVFVFDPPRPSPPGLLRKGEDTCRSILGMKPGLDPNPEIFTEYFRSFFSSVNDFDKPRFDERILKENTDVKYQFRSLSKVFHLIDDQSQAGVIVLYRGEKSSSEEPIERLHKGQIDRDLLRRLQRFSVTIQRRLLAVLLDRGMIVESHGFYVQANPGLYKRGIGLDIDAEWAPESFIM